MSREKQIEEMAQYCCNACEMGGYIELEGEKIPCALDNDYKSCTVALETAEKIYNAGYRKQSENMVEVVRCCDCKYCENVIHSIVDEPKWFCTRMVRAFDVDPTCFCSYGEMKGGE